MDWVEKNLPIRGEFTVSDVSFFEPETTLAIVDCEGSEFKFLDPVAAPALAECDVLVEGERT